MVAGHDAATLCGDVRWFLLRELAKTIPDDVGGGDGEEATDADAAGRRRRRRKEEEAVEEEGRPASTGVNDLCLFEAALGLGGFDEAFEAKVSARVPPSALSRRRIVFVFFFGRRFFFFFFFFFAAPDRKRSYPRVLRFHARTRSFQKRDTNVGFYLGHLRETLRSLPSTNIG